MMVPPGKVLFHRYLSTSSEFDDIPDPARGAIVILSFLPMHFQLLQL